MKTYKQFLNEKREFPIYHATKGFPSELYDILFVTKGLKPLTTHENRKLLLDPPQYRTSGVSTTRNIRLAQNWGSVIFEFNHEAVDARYRIIPVQFFDHNTSRLPELDRYPVNEYEEFIVSNKPIPIKPYVKRIWVNRKLLTSLAKSAEISGRDREIYNFFMITERAKNPLGVTIKYF